jgi:hypothetical protein
MDENEPAIQLYNFQKERTVCGKNNATLQHEQSRDKTTVYCFPGCEKWKLHQNREPKSPSDREPNTN